MIKKITEAFNFVNPKLTRVFIPFILKNPKYLKKAKKLLKNFDRCEKTREEIFQNECVMVPPILILSITHQCNLNCLGCFASAVGISSTDQSKFKQKGLTVEEWERIIIQARELGVFTFLIAGGEPFVFEGLLDLCERFDDSIFLVFSNGTALKETDYNRLKKIGNTGIMVSVEGSDQMTDMRRGIGIHKMAVQTAKRLGKSGILSGISVTITKDNFQYWMDEENLEEYIQNGLHMGFFTEYIPVGSDENTTVKKDSVCSTSNQEISSQQCLTKEQRLKFRKQILYYKENKEMFIIHSPGDEEIFGGCVSSGKGFAHINAFGDLTPCPVSDIATHNMRNSDLKAGLSSELFIKLRETGHILENIDGPCALFEHQEELEELRKSLGAYRTGV